MIRKLSAWLSALVAGCWLAVTEARADTTESVWQTSYGALTVRVADDGEVTGAYEGGAIAGTMVSDDLATGIWFADTGNVSCEAARHGTRHWGRFAFSFLSETEFSGSWTYCDQVEQADRWDGQRVSVVRAAAPDPVSPAAGTVRDRLIGHWTDDVEALNRENRDTGRPPEGSSGVLMAFGHTEWIFDSGGERAASRYFVAGDTIWDDDTCRGGEVDLATAQARYQDGDGSVIVTVEDGQAMCWTIESLTDDRLVLAYVGARLNRSFYMRPRQDRRAGE